MNRRDFIGSHSILTELTLVPAPIVSKFAELAKLAKLATRKSKMYTVPEGIVAYNGKPSTWQEEVIRIKEELV